MNIRNGLVKKGNREKRNILCFNELELESLSRVFSLCICREHCMPVILSDYVFWVWHFRSICGPVSFKLYPLDYNCNYQKVAWGTLPSNAEFGIRIHGYFMKPCSWNVMMVPSEMDEDRKLVELHNLLSVSCHLLFVLHSSISKPYFLYSLLSWQDTFRWRSWIYRIAI